MQVVSVTEFKAHCLEFLNQVAKTGQPILLTRRGKPTSMVCLPPAETKQKIRFGQFEDQGEIVGDIVGPTGEDWEALQ